GRRRPLVRGGRRSLVGGGGGAEVAREPHPVSAMLRRRSTPGSQERHAMTPSTSPQVPLLAGRNLVQVALTPRDPERSKAFYRDVLGLTLLFEVPNMVFYQMGNVRLMVGVEPSMTPGGSVLYIDAPDIDAVGAQLEARGIRFGGPAVVVQRTD